MRASSPRLAKHISNGYPLTKHLANVQSQDFPFVSVNCESYLLRGVKSERMTWPQHADTNPTPTLNSQLQMQQSFNVSVMSTYATETF